MPNKKINKNSLLEKFIGAFELLVKKNQIELYKIQKQKLVHGKKKVVLSMMTLIKIKMNNKY